ncbi:MAG: flagellar filament capping protein FliD [Spirochaetaceae bacterium]|jgi:flagellar hook-associated protein 2|nr:flagellar filament capping protein FliD [Spirochaetaceae bacterium]
MPDISVPGIKSRFDTEKIVEGLMQVERLPKERIERANDTLATQKLNWQTLGQRITQVRENSRLLYSYQNPFNEKSAASSNEAVLSAFASREAEAQSHEFVVKQTAGADRFLSKPLNNDYRVPEGSYVFSLGEHDISFKFAGGTLQDFVNTLNRRGDGNIRAGLVAVQKGHKTLVFESLMTGEENRLSFAGDALKLALQTGVVEQSAAEPKITNIKAVAARGDSYINEAVSGDGMQTPPMSSAQISLGNIEPSRTLILRFETAVIAEAGASSAAQSVEAVLPAGAEYQTADLPPQPSDTPPSDTAAPPPEQAQLPETAQSPEQTQTQSQAAAARVDNLAVLSLEFSDGTVTALPPIKDSSGFSQNQYQLYPLSQGKEISALNVNNNNTHNSIAIRNIQLFDPAPAGDVKPLNPVSVARDALILMDGIEIQRPSNTIDDLIPGLTLTARAASETPVNLDVEVDTSSIKDAVITFVGNYNRLMAELNVLTRNDESVIRELNYLSPAEQEELRGRLGAFSGDSELQRFRGSLQQVMTSPYIDSNGQERLLSSFGITTDARRAGGYDPSKMRGYMEINEAVLDEALKNDVDALRQIFGRDSDGDLIIDTGLAYSLNQAVQPYVELGGVISTKTAGIDSRISANDRRIETIDRQLTVKERTLKTQYGELEGAYTRMERLSNSLEQFGRQTGATK